ncbi:hypothetical protein ACFU6R_22905 [Streptomyces sp. NPDC057499]|uniref:hypothetical protein n=1 Tax=Streptomyces sp. NPDC057499 TaxID=3346150 RepID=UPI0036753AFD
MGTTRAWIQGRGRRVPAACALVAAAVLTTAACEPAGGLNSASIAVTTDRVGTGALESNGVDVRWLSCSAGVDGARALGVSPAASVPRSANVDCSGRTGSGETITLTGKVTQELGGRCVRGDLTARAGGRSVFRADVLGNCDAPPPVSVITPIPPAAGGNGFRPTVTVTVTVTETPLGK